MVYLYNAFVIAARKGEIKISLGRGNVLHNSCEKGDPMYRMNSMKKLGTGG